MLPPAPDMPSLLQHLLQAVKPFAEKKNIKIESASTSNNSLLPGAGQELHAGFTKLMASIIDYMPEGHALYINTGVIEKDHAPYLSLKIRNTGINLKMVTAIIKDSCLPVELLSSGQHETTFEVCYPLSLSVNNSALAKGNSINYVSMVSRIRNYFARLNDPVARLSESKPKDAAFLTQINQCILDNMVDERFDANRLSTAMAMSRAQLLRRLKSVTGHSPGFYIKTMRLERARELLETTELTISEAAYKTGFGTPSNFSKVFAEKYGVTPTQFRRINRNATNK